MHYRRILGAVGAAVLAVSIAAGQAAHAYRFPVHAPPVRFDAAVAYSAVRGRTVLFGGQLPSSGGVAADVWEWDGIDWTDRTPPAPAAAPTPRSGIGLVDLADGRVFMYGGGTDAWTWDGTSWTLVPAAPPGLGPPPLRFHAMGFDAARGRVVIFGGQPAFLAPPVGDLWEWDGAQWIHFPPPPGVAWPPARLNAAMAYDPVRGRSVLFGGRTLGSGTIFGDTWEWDGTTWSAAAPAAPPVPRWGASMAFDPFLGRVMLHGGSAAPAAGGGQLNAQQDLWSWDGNAWMVLTMSGIGAYNRAQHGLAPGPSPGRLVVIGGRRELCLPPNPFGGGGCYYDSAPFAEITTALSPLGGGSMNSLSAQLDLGTDRWFSTGAPGLVPAVVMGGQTVHFFVGGGYQRSFVIFAGIPNPSAATFSGCGTADIGDPAIGFSDLVPLLSGSITNAPVGAPYLGKSWFDLRVPPALSGAQFGLQAAVIAPPGSTCAMDLTGAFAIIVL